MKYFLNKSVLAGFVLYITISLFVLSCSAKPESTASSASSSAVTKQQTTMPDVKVLMGRWLRPDGGYILEIRSASADGKLDVGYFNPNSIHVARAEWVVKDNLLYALVELQDVNYPGSTYGLEYKVGSDHLVGTYYQAVEKSTYDVEFVREK